LFRNSRIQLSPTKWIGWTDFTQWMYFECGAWLLYQTRKPDMYRESDSMTYSRSGTVWT
jgi:hypothetical protein